MNRATFVIALTLSLSLSVSATPAFSQKLSKAHQRWIERDVSALVTREEAQLFRRLPGDDDRDRFQEIFWTRRDPDLSTPENELRTAYEERVDIANDRLRGGMLPGSRTDMGQVFLLLGFPANISRGRAGGGGSGSGLNSTSGGKAASLESSTSEAAPPSGSAGGGGSRFQTWSYSPIADLGIPAGLDVQFRAQRGIGYHLVESEILDEVLESRRQSLVAHPYITYDLDAAGNLLPPAIPTEGGVATELLENLIAMKTTSNALPFRILPSFFRSESGTTYVPLLIELDGSTLASSDGRVDVSFFGALENAEGEVVQRFEERAELEAGDHVRYEIPLQVPPGDYMAHVGVLDEESGTHGSRISALQVPVFDQKDVLLSSVVLYDAAEQTDEPSGIPGRAFQFAKVKLEPIGSGAFTRSDALGIFFYVYGSAGAEVTARYVFFKDGVEKGQTRPTALLAAEGIALASEEIPLASFEPGNYTLVIEVEDKKSGEVLQKRARFKLEP